ncbi:hypothetical protein L345_04783, partial [Ophiophagus hannah]
MLLEFIVSTTPAFLVWGLIVHASLLHEFTGNIWLWKPNDTVKEGIRLQRGKNEARNGLGVRGGIQQVLTNSGEPVAEILSSSENRQISPLTGDFTVSFPPGRPVGTTMFSGRDRRSGGQGPPGASGAVDSRGWVLPQRKPYPWGLPANIVELTAPQGGPVCESAWDVGKPLSAAGQRCPKTISGVKWLYAKHARYIPKLGRSWSKNGSSPVLQCSGLEPGMSAFQLISLASLTAEEGRKEGGREGRKEGKLPVKVNTLGGKEEERPGAWIRPIECLDLAHGAALETAKDWPEVPLPVKMELREATQGPPGLCFEAMMASCSNGGIQNVLPPVRWPWLCGRTLHACTHFACAHTPNTHFVQVRGRSNSTPASLHSPGCFSSCRVALCCAVQSSCASKAEDKGEYGSPGRPVGPTPERWRERVWSLLFIAATSTAELDQTGRITPLSCSPLPVKMEAWGGHTLHTGRGLVAMPHPGHAPPNTTLMRPSMKSV